MKAPNEKKILFSGSSREETITLLESAEDYEYVEVVFQNTTGITNRIFMKNNEKSTIYYMEVPYSTEVGNYVQIAFNNIKLVNNTITFMTGGYFNVLPNKTISNCAITNLAINIKEVIGHNKKIKQ